MRDRFVICRNPDQAERDKTIRDQLLAQLADAIDEWALHAQAHDFSSACSQRIFGLSPRLQLRKPDTLSHREDRVFRCVRWASRLAADRR